MYRSSLLALVLALSGVFFVNTITVHADSGSAYDINGSMTIPGNSSCPSCSETINFSFELTPNPTALVCNGFGEPCVENMNIGSFGPLGTFTAPYQLQAGYIPFFDGGDEVDLDMLFPNGYLAAPVANPGDLWTCDTAICVADFSPDGVAFTNGRAYTVAEEFTATLVATPEPPTATLGLCGILTLCLLVSRRKLRA